MNLIEESKIDSSRSILLVTWLTFIVLLAAFNIIYKPFFPLNGGMMGHDYSAALPAWLDGLIWFQKNGLQVPWFTPSFCAGQPFFPDPQSAFYSIPQFINFLAGPLNTAFLTLMGSATLMFWGGFLLMRKVFLTTATSAVLVGGMLMFNGFLPHRLIVGHVMYHSFAMIPWIALLLLAPVRERFHGTIAALAASLILAYWVYAGFGTLILAGFLSVVLVALVHSLNGGDLRVFIVRSTIAGLLALGISIAKLWATFSFLANFPRTSYLLPGAASVSDGIMMIGGGLFLPSEWAFELGAPKLRNVQWGLMPHEWAYNFGTVTALLFVTLVVCKIFSRSMNRKFYISPGQGFLCLLLLLGLIWPLAFNIWDPTWNALLKRVPIINSASTALRWLIVYIPIFAVFTGLLLERSNWRQISGPIVFLCLSGTVLQSAFEPRAFYLAQEYDSRPMIIADDMLRNGHFVPEIRELGKSAEVQVGAFRLNLGLNDTFIAGVSQTACYNAIFGYRLENFPGADIKTGAVLNAHDGFLNLKNPACYVYPKENGCKPGDRFRADQLNEAKAFVEYRPFAFELSDGQKRANIVTVLSITFVLGILLIWLCIALGQYRRVRHGIRSTN